MVERDSDDWTVEMACPFCEKVIVEACDRSMLPDDMTDDEREEIICTEKGFDNCDGHCEHLAFFSDWAYAGSRVEEAWAPQIGAVFRLSLHATNSKHIEVKP